MMSLSLLPQFASSVSASDMATTSATAGTAAVVSLEWSAPGDDSLTGRATLYDLRYRAVPIQESNFATAVPAVGVPLPSAPGLREHFTVTGLTPGMTYYFALKTSDEAGNWSRLSNVIVRTAASTSVAVDGAAQVTVAFAPPFPNPARASATFAMSVPNNDTEVEVEAFDVTGRHVATIAEGRQPAGETKLVWNLRGDSGQRLGAGVYLVRARIGETRFVRRVLVTP